MAILGQRVLYASAILPADLPGEAIQYYRENGSAIQMANGLVRPCYQVAVASDAALPALASSLFEQIGESDPEMDFSGIRWIMRSAGSSVWRRKCQD